MRTTGPRHTGRMQQPRDEQSVRIAYDEVADAYADHFRSTEPEAPLELAMVEHFTSLVPAGGRVLDAGCGAGRLVPVLAGQGHQVVGIDLSPGVIRRARRDHPTSATEVASLLRLPFRNSTFDGYFSWYSTIHLRDEQLPPVFAEAARVIRPGGIVLTAFQSGRGVHDVSAAYRRRGHEITLERYHRAPDDVASLLSGAGLREVARLELREPDGADQGLAVLIARR